jgi:uncharacterized protein GlcG (DUF336 family)
MRSSNFATFSNTRLARAALLPLVFCAMACQTSRIEARTDQRAYTIASSDSVGTVRLTLRNRGTHPIYIQTADGQAAILVMIRLDRNGKRLVGNETLGQKEIWSEIPLSKTMPAMGLVRLEPDSILASVYTLPRGVFWVCAYFGDTPEKPEEHFLWMDRFGIR